MEEKRIKQGNKVQDARWLLGNGWAGSRRRESEKEREEREGRDENGGRRLCGSAKTDRYLR